jgi:hypothetical protein
MENDSKTLLIFEDTIGFGISLEIKNNRYL